MSKCLVVKGNAVVPDRHPAAARTTRFADHPGSNLGFRIARKRQESKRVLRGGSLANRVFSSHLCGHRARSTSEFETSAMGFRIAKRKI